jgi:hypothetical protein
LANSTFYITWTTFIWLFDPQAAILKLEKDPKEPKRLTREIEKERSKGTRAGNAKERSPEKRAESPKGKPEQQVRRTAKAKQGNPRSE